MVGIAAAFTMFKQFSPEKAKIELANSAAIVEVLS